MKAEELLARGGHLPDSHLTEVLRPAPWICLRPLITEDVPRWLCFGGFGCRTSMLNGTYELLPERSWTSRPTWRRLSPLAAGSPSFPKFVFFWQETGNWLIGPELHEAHSAVARSAPGRWAAASPDRCQGRWAALNGRGFEEDARIFCRRQRTSTGGMESTTSLPASRRQSLAGTSSPQSSPRNVAGERGESGGTAWLEGRSRNAAAGALCGSRSGYFGGSKPRWAHAAGALAAAPAPGADGGTGSSPLNEADRCLGTPEEATSALLSPASPRREAPHLGSSGGTPSSPETAGNGSHGVGPKAPNGGSRWPAPRCSGRSASPPRPVGGAAGARGLSPGRGLRALSPLRWKP